MYLRILHTGMTVEEILKLDDVEFGKFVGQSLQITRDAGLTPYQRDFVPAFCISPLGGLKLTGQPTENMVSLLSPP
jgi:hypothetical protein